MDRELRESSQTREGHMKFRSKASLSVLGLIVSVLFVSTAFAVSVPLGFVPLTGVTGGSPAGTTVFRADLSGLALTSILSITLQDTSGGLGGSPGRFSGFDLDAVKLAASSVGTAALAASLVGLSVFDFSAAGTLFTPGTERPTADPLLTGPLFGTSGGTINNPVATLGSFDGNSTTGATADGFASLGDGGIVTFNLTSAVLPAGNFLYFGEVGGNGETISGNITVSDEQVPAIPEPATILLFGTGLAFAVLWRLKTLS
jgi:hypothetical protein